MVDVAKEIAIVHACAVQCSAAEAGGCGQSNILSLSRIWDDGGMCDKLHIFQSFYQGGLKG